jgi:twitching motility protein PilU
MKPAPLCYEGALRNADSVNELRLNIKLNGKEAKDKDIMSGIERLNVVQRKRLCLL